MWAGTPHGHQRQAQVTYLGQHAVQGGLMHDVSRKHGLSGLQVIDLQPVEYSDQYLSRCPLTRMLQKLTFPPSTPLVRHFLSSAGAPQCAPTFAAAGLPGQWPIGPHGFHHLVNRRAGHLRILLVCLQC